jgi:hypothetical protein
VKSTADRHTAVLAAIALLLFATALHAGPTRSAAAATIAYPDLEVQVPVSEISVGHPTPATRDLQFSHITWNAGTGPLEIRPAYDPSTGIAAASQALYATDGSVASTAPIVVSMAYEPLEYKYRFPLGAYGLYAVGAGGAVGGLVAPSPKVDFCMTADTYVGGVPNTPSQTHYPQTNCGVPSDTLGLDVGWGDKYDYTDPGENIDLTNVPDGTYWLRAAANPYHYLAESNAGNDVTDTQITIAGDRVTVLQQTHPDSTPPTVALTAPSPGSSLSGAVTLTATASGPHPVGSVQFMLDGQPLGPALASAPYAYRWNTAGTPPGSHYLSAQAVDAAGFYGTAPATPITIARQLGTFTLDETAQQSGAGPVTLSPISTASPGELLLAFVSSDGAPAGGQAVTVSGAGLSWSLVQRSTSQPGDAEIWEATAPAALSGAAVRSVQAQSGFDQLLTVVALRGASGVGASASAGAASGAPSISLTATSAGSLVLAAGDDWDTATARTPAPGQVLLSQLVDGGPGDTFWSQAASGTAPAAGSRVTVNDTAPVGDRWNLAAVEVLPGGSPPPPDTQPPAVSIANPASGQTLSGTDPVTAMASDDVAVASVQLSLDGRPLGPALTAAPYAYQWDTTQVANGGHQLGATATDTSGNVGTATPVTVTVSNPEPPVTCFIVDARTSIDGHGAVTTPAFHTGQPGELLLAFAASDGPAAGPQSLTVTGAGLNWTLVRRANSQAGTAEVWEATAPQVLSSAAVTSRQAAGGYDQSLTVIAIQGAAGTGASVAGSAASGAPSVTLTTTGVDSLVFGAGNDWDTATARTPGVNQVLVHQWLDTGTGDTFWAQNTSVQAVSPGTAVTLNDTAPTGDRWNLAAVEVVGKPL